ncbi:hypothetical protein PS645_01469 [Pseudomonas fluorescens]|uniref:FRG domain-containing protein n=1 Tax=Pseudomonas fluorescens TaxID=294 RepID=A0A5E6R935_PSEFL|nr:FRG domain-containing protein [Pseudomonas fluorescens]VVM64929.1 hypothetical protein PS645_01469 [Pseudomonas fluorescens]
MGSPSVIPFTTALELLDYVSPLNPIWRKSGYIFRGQPSDGYPLTPSVCRRGAGSFAHGSPRRVFDETTSGQVLFEYEVLRRFLLGCDRAGLTLPSYNTEVKRLLSDSYYYDNYLETDKPWPPALLHEIMAVAQHYDVPTRLLDWTERSFVACYFAASSANFELERGDAKLAVWALDTTHSAEWKTVQVIKTPGGTSKNQAAQSGLFTTHNITTYDIRDVYKVEALEDVEEIYAQPTQALIKMTLPISEAPELLDLCSKLGVDGSTLFPGYQGVAKTVKDWVNIETGVRLSESAFDEYQESYNNPD